MQLPGPLVSTDWLVQHLQADDLRIVDVSIFITPNDPEPGYAIESGRAAWEGGHIPGATFLDLLTDFSDLSAPFPMTMLSPELFAARAEKAGIGSETTVVVYAAQSMMFATRFWWMLRAIGCDSVAVLDGGWEKWQREGKPQCAITTSYPPARLDCRPRPQLWAQKTEVLQTIEDDSVCTLYTLEPEVYSGKIARYGRPGHIPGSYNVYYNDLVDTESGTLLSPVDLSKYFDKSSAMQKSRVICYCGGGVAATIDALALTLLGHPNVAVYDGSMAEWVSDSSLPLQCGDTP